MGLDMYHARGDLFPAIEYERRRGFAFARIGRLMIELRKGAREIALTVGGL